jgi:hypothetical protein
VEAPLIQRDLALAGTIRLRPGTAAGMALRAAEGADLRVPEGRPVARNAEARLAELAELHRRPRLAPRGLPPHGVWPMYGLNDGV